MPFRTAILSYHSQNVCGRDTGDNDHVALEQDLDRLHLAGAKFIPLSLLMDRLDGKRRHEDMSGTVCLSFDDGCDFDVRDLDFPAPLSRSFRLS